MNKALAKVVLPLPSGPLKVNVQGGCITRAKFSPSVVVSPSCFKKSTTANGELDAVILF